MLTQGNTGNAQQLVSDAWRHDDISADIEAQARDAFSGLISPDDDKVRMDARLYAEDDDGGLRAAQHLDAVQVAIAKARAAVFDKDSNAKALLDAVPASGQRDAGYIFSRIQWLRRQDKIDEAGHLMASAPNDPDVIGNARSMVDRTAADRAQTPRSRRRQAGLHNSKRRRDAQQRQLSLRPGFHRRLDCAPLSARANGGLRTFRPDRRRRLKPGNPGALVLLARPRGRSLRPRAGGAQLLRDCCALSDRLLWTTGARPPWPR